MKRVVYTAVFGGYERILEQPASSDTSIDFVCFTDRPVTLDGSWHVEIVNPLIPWDAARSVRALKSIGHPALRQYDQSLWIDNRILIKQAPDELFDSWLHQHDIALARHSYRATVLDEFKIVLSSSLDDPSRVREQLSFFEKHAPDVLTQQPYWGAMIARNHNDATRDAMRTWLDLILRHSRRDQLSVNYALERSSARVRGVIMDNFESQWHRWINTDELPKNKKMRFSPGYRYPLMTHIWDLLYASKPLRYTRSKFGRSH